MNKEMIEEILDEIKKILELKTIDSIKLFNLLGKEDFNTFKDLINRGANTKVQKESWSLLHYATNIDHLKLLLDTSAKEFINKCYITSNGIIGEAPLHLLLLKKNDELIKLLIEAGADVNIRNGNDETPLHYVKTTGALKLLLDAGADLNLKNRLGETPENYYKRCIRKDLLQTLEEYKNEQLKIKEEDQLTKIANLVLKELNKTLKL